MRYAIGTTVLALLCASFAASFPGPASAEEFAGWNYINNETDKFALVTDVGPGGGSLHSFCLKPFSYHADELHHRLSSVRFELTSDDCRSASRVWSDTVAWKHDGPLPHAAFEYWIRARPYHVRFEQLAR